MEEEQEKKKRGWGCKSPPYEQRAAVAEEALHEEEAGESISVSDTPTPFET